MCHTYRIGWVCGHLWKGQIHKCEEYLSSKKRGVGKECRRSGRCTLTECTTVQQHKCFACMFPDMFVGKDPGEMIGVPVEYPALSAEDVPPVTPSASYSSFWESFGKRLLDRLQRRYSVDPMEFTNDVLQPERVRDLAGNTDNIDDHILSTGDLEWLGMVIACLAYRIEHEFLNKEFADPKSTYRKALYYAYRNLDRKHTIALMYKRCAERMDNRGLLGTPISLDLPEDAKTCPICFETLGCVGENNVVENPLQLPCKHIFGHRCLEIWVPGGIFGSCPLCRFAFRRGEYLFPGQRTSQYYRELIDEVSPAWMRKFRDGIFDPKESPAKGWEDYPGRLVTKSVRGEGIGKEAHGIVDGDRLSAEVLGGEKQRSGGWKAVPPRRADAVIDCG